MRRGRGRGIKREEWLSRRQADLCCLVRLHIIDEYCLVAEVWWRATCTNIATSIYFPFSFLNSTITNDHTCRNEWKFTAFAVLPNSIPGIFWIEDVVYGSTDQLHSLPFSLFPAQWILVGNFFVTSPSIAAHKQRNGTLGVSRGITQKEK